MLLLAAAIGLSGVDNLVSRLAEFPIWVIAGVLALLLANLFIVSFRFWRILEHFSFRVPWPVALRATVSGHVAGQFMITLFGQVMGRQAVLRDHGLQPVVIAGLAAYERAVLALVSGLMCLFGMVYLLGGAAIGKFVSQISLPEIIIAAGGGLALSLWLGRSRFEKDLSTIALTRLNFARVAEIFNITFIARFLMLLTYVIGIFVFKPDIGMLQVLSAAAIISFIAALPITVNGWGVREIASIYVLGHLGVPAADAVAVSIVIGLCSTLVIFAVAPFLLKTSEMSLSNKRSLDVHRSQVAQPVTEFEKISAWILGMAVAVAVFFQAHIALQAGVINLNLGDPFAILALAAVVVHFIFFRQWPVWRIGKMNLALAVVSLLLLLGFLNGWLEIGITQWALSGRLFGWLVLLGYLAAGYLMVAHTGAHGLRRLAETMIATVVVIVILQIGFRLLDQWGLNIGVQITRNFEGYAANRNAFAFQLLTCTAFFFGYASLYTRYYKIASSRGKNTLFPLLFGVLLAGLVWAGSRAGWGVAAILIITAWIGRWVETRMLIKGIASAFLICLAVWLVSHVPVGKIVSGQVTLNGVFTGQYSPGFSDTQSLIRSDSATEASDNERWDTFRYALELWQDAPVVGAGLGVFREKSPNWIGYHQVIHNTFLWILAEFGVIGALILGAIFFMLLRYAYLYSRSLPSARILLFLLITFAFFSLTHEIFYQRIFWLVLGAVLAQPFVCRGAARITAT